MTKDEFFEKYEWEGCDLSYFGDKIEISDDPELQRILNSILPFYHDLMDLYDEWDMG